jgi:hypothetical protein
LKQFDRENNMADFIVRTENLEDDLISALEEAGISLDRAAVDLIRGNSSNKTNVSKHRDTDYYYDSDSLAIVAERERFIIDKFSYIKPT